MSAFYCCCYQNINPRGYNERYRGLVGVTRSAVYFKIASQSLPGLLVPRGPVPAGVRFAMVVLYVCV